MTIKYRIAWKAIETDAAGHGEPVFRTYAAALDTAEQLNRAHGAWLYHCPEPVEVPDDREAQP